ncbi:hypothetical protein BDV12DRAFT_184406 [Aspergillus spectabilis]
MPPPIAIDQADVPVSSLKTRQHTPCASQDSPSALFDPAKHLAAAPSPLAWGYLEHRRELFSQDILSNCLHHTRPRSVQIREVAPRYAHFIYQFWHSPDVLRIISDIAGVELVPAMDYEISHTNVQLGPAGFDGLGATLKQEAKVTNQSKPIIEWHKDSHPFVCVVMLSDASFPTEEIRLIRTYITHTAAPVTNMPERVTIVTSCRPKNPTLLDETTNANVRNKSHLSELYYQWTTYRLDVLAERAGIAADALRKRYEENMKNSDWEGQSGLCSLETVNVADIQKWADEQIVYIQQTVHEMRPLVQ